MKKEKGTLSTETWPTLLSFLFVSEVLLPGINMKFLYYMLADLGYSSKPVGFLKEKQSESSPEQL